jgi:nitric oxide reductase subunit B
MQALVWLRVPGDTVFAVGVFAFAWFALRALLARRSS